jgi:hypothetical protein
MNAEWPNSPWLERPVDSRPWRGSLSHRTGYWVVAFAFLMNMAMSAIPTPLYGLYQQRDGLSSFMITVIFAVYAVGVIASLFLAGHVSDWIGRRRVLVTGLYVNVVSAAVFIFAPSLTGLIVARIISGISVGLATATATAYLADLHFQAYPQANRRRAQLMAIFVNLGGIGLGPLISGLMAQNAPAPMVLPYVVTGLVLVGLATFVLATPETVPAPQVRTRWRPQHIAVPAGARGQFFAGAVAGLTAFAVYGVFSSLVPRFLADTLGSNSRSLAGAVAFSAFISGAIAQIALSRMKPVAMLRVSVPILLVGLTLLVVGMWFAVLTVFVVGGIVTGAGAGLVFRGAMVRAGEAAPAESRAEVMAGFFLASYLGLSLPVIGLGVALSFAAAREVMLAFVIVVALAIVLSVRSATREPSVGASDHRELLPTEK